jgi:hypothetical protein
MRTRMSWAAAAAAILVAVPLAAQDFHWRGRVGAGKTVEIKGVNGAIEATAADGDEVEVMASKRGHRSDPGSVRVEAVEHAGGVTICAVYPDVDGRRNECLPGDAGRNSTRDNDVDVHFVVRVPRGVAFAPRTVNGNVDVTDLDGDVDVSTVNGSIQVSTSGHAQAQTVNGSIRAQTGRADWTGDAEFKTVNGSITVTLPSATAADVKAATVNGEIETDFPLTVRGRLSRRRLEGTIGSGGRALELETVNGSIHIRKSS